MKKTDDQIKQGESTKKCWRNQGGRGADVQVRPSLRPTQKERRENDTEKYKNITFSCLSTMVVYKTYLMSSNRKIKSPLDLKHH